MDPPNDAVSNGLEQGFAVMKVRPGSSNGAKCMPLLICFAWLEGPGISNFNSKISAALLETLLEGGRHGQTPVDLDCTFVLARAKVLGMNVDMKENQTRMNHVNLVR